MKVITLASTVALLAGSANGWVLNREAMKNAFSVATISAAIASAPMIANAVDFSGAFTDAKHPGVERIITVQGTEALIKGNDKGKEWSAKGEIDPVDTLKITADFSSNGGPKELVGKWVTGGMEKAAGIEWADGNRWSIKEGIDIN